MLKHLFKSSLVIVFGVGLTIGASRWSSQERLENVEAERILAAEADRWSNQERFEHAQVESILAPGKFHKPLQTIADYPGIMQPDFQEAGEVDLIDSTPIIGIEVEGDAYAFVMEKMWYPKAHILNLVLHHKAISVSYCYLVDCVRVLTDEASEPIPLHVGGLDVDNQMVFLLTSERYGQMSSDLPLADYPFVQTELGEWKGTHPDTLVCIPNSPVSIDHRRSGHQPAGR